MRNIINSEIDNVDNISNKDWIKLNDDQREYLTRMINDLSFKSIISPYPKLVIEYILESGVYKNEDYEKTLLNLQCKRYNEYLKENR